MDFSLLLKAAVMGGGGATEFIPSRPREPELGGDWLGFARARTRDLASHPARGILAVVCLPREDLGVGAHRAKDRRLAAVI